MAWTYIGVYADLIKTSAHEGYAVRILPDGDVTTAWTTETREFIAYHPRCECGWRGTDTYPPTEHGEDLAAEAWEREHIQVMVRQEASKHTVPATVLIEFARGLRHKCQGAGDECLRSMCSAADELTFLLDDLAAGNDISWSRGDR